ncbi:MAG: hypothetical protein RSD49_01580 [Hafnia sp.]
MNEHAKVPTAHSIELGALVEVNLDYCDEHKLRLFVQGHTRDFDGHPIYALTHKYELVGKLLDSNAQDKTPTKRMSQFDKGAIINGFPAHCLIVIESAYSIQSRIKRESSYHG